MVHVELPLLVMDCVLELHFVEGVGLVVHDVVEDLLLVDVVVELEEVKFRVGCVVVRGEYHTCVRRHVCESRNNFSGLAVQNRNSRDIVSMQ